MTIRLRTADGVSRALRWTDRHPQALPGHGVLLYRHGGTVLAALPAGAVIEVTTPKEAQRIARALALSPEEIARYIRVRNNPC